MLGENCFLPGKEGEQLPGNCYLPEKEGEQWPERRELRFEVDLDLLLPGKEGEVLLGSCYCLPWGQGGCLPACLFGLLPAWGRLLLLLEDQVIFPSFSLTKFWELFNLSKFDFVKPSFTYLMNEALAFSKSLC